MKASASPKRRGSRVPAEHQPVNATVPSRPELFPIVGIGASAGGLEACSSLLAHLPQQTGMAFVYVQHLDPTHSSALPEILSRSTRIPVIPVSDGTQLQPDNLYIIPPNADMIVKQGALRLSRRTLVHGQHRPIDTFFSSLASDRRDRAIGVVLSGTAEDGSAGCAAIKSEGGITLAQDQVTAKYVGMPRHAESTGCVDFVLPPEGIAAELAEIAKHLRESPSIAQEEEPDAWSEGTETVFTIIRQAKGLDLADYKQTTVRQSVSRRMLVSRVHKFQDYLSLLRRSEGELDALCRDLLANVSGFFRDPGAFDILSAHVFPKLVRNRNLGTDPIRVWVPECSTGEEAYSLGIVLLEYVRSRKESETTLNPVQIFATELSENSLERARSGIYPEAALGKVSPERLKRFFAKMEGRYQINGETRDAFVFAKQDVTNDPPFSRLDLITCRNLRTYLNPALQRRVIPLLHYGLKPGGYLMLGGAGSLSAFTDHFTQVEKKYGIYQKKNSAARLVTFFAGVGSLPGRPGEAGTTLPKRFPQVFSAQDEMDRILVERFVPASIVLNSEMEIVQFRGTAGVFLEPVLGQPPFKLAKVAKPEMLGPLRAALNRAKKERLTVWTKGARVKSHEVSRPVDLEVIPIHIPANREPYYIVAFHDQAENAPRPEPPKRRRKLTLKQASVADENDRLRSEIRHLRDQMQSLIHEHETTSHEFKSTNAELLAANEELQSTNEELETTKEELQSTAEELTTLNEEVQNRNSELSAINSDLINLFSNANIPIVMVNNDLRIRRFTPPAEKLLNLRATDIGRPVGQIRTNLDVNSLEEIARRTIESTSLQQREVRDAEGCWYLMRARPYRTLENSIDGAVISFQDIDALKHSLEETKSYADTVIETARESILILDRDLRVVVANRAFYAMFKTSKADTENTPIHELGNHQWDIPWLRQMLDEIMTNSARIEDFEVRHKFSHIGERIMLLNARRIEPDPQRPLIILTIEDVTEKHTQMDALIRQSALLDLARDAVLMRDLDANIQYWNRGAEEMYGWKKNEAVGKRTHDLLRTQFPQPWKEIEEQLRREGHWEAELVHTRRDGQHRIVSSRWALLGEGDGQPIILEINTDITDQKRSEERLRQLSGYLMQVQDEERRRIARELHDSTGQKLAAAKMQIDTMVRRTELKQHKTVLSESADLIDEAFQEIRTISQLLHPPLLDAAGLISATRSMVDGFSNRAAIPVKFNASGELGRLPQAVELALFRVTQECLNNIRRHSGAKQAEIDLARNGESITLQVHDNGKGIPAEVLSGGGNHKQLMGVGILGMKERLSQLGGTLEITSDKSGTTVRVVVPSSKAVGSSAH
jgi:two-component system, chemotaxis family, CheB/CheR fusion protein